MNCFKKIACLVLSAVMLLGASGLTGCFNVDTTEKKKLVLETIEKIPEYIKAQDYESLREYLYSDNPKVREIFKLGEGVDDEETVAVRKEIAATMRSNVHEDTLEFSNLGQTAKIKVDFMVVDFNKFAENDRYCRDLDSMKEDIWAANSKAVIIYTFPMRFIFRDGKAIFENDELLEDLFEFASFDEVVFAGNLTEYLGDYTFVDSEDNTYKDTKEIRLEIDIDEKGQKFNWIYDYEVFYTGPIGSEESIFKDSCEEGKGLEKILIRHSTGKELDAGTYRIEVSYKGSSKDYSCRVEKTEKEDNLVTKNYQVPEGDTYELAGTDVSVNLLPGYSFVDGDSYLGKQLLSTTSGVHFIVAQNSYATTQEFMYDFTISSLGVESDKVLIDALTQSSKKIYEQSGAKISTKKEKIKIGSKEYNCVDFKIDKNNQNAHLRMIIIPDPKSYHIVAILGTSKDSVKTYTSMLKGS